MRCAEARRSFESTTHATETPAQKCGAARRASAGEGQPHVWEVPSESRRRCEDVYASAVAGAAAGSAAFAVPLLVLGRR